MFWRHSKMTSCSLTYVVHFVPATGQSTACVVGRKRAMWWLPFFKSVSIYHPFTRSRAWSCTDNRRFVSLNTRIILANDADTINPFCPKFSEWICKLYNIITIKTTNRNWRHLSECQMAFHNEDVRYDLREAQVLWGKPLNTHAFIR